MKPTTRMSVGALALAVAALAAPAVEGQRDPRAHLFVDRGCSDCHTVIGLGIKSRADVGPDLTYAYGNVMYRYGMTLERFFEQPPGMMRFVIAGGHVRLNRAQTDSLIRVLRGLYGEALAKTNGRADVPIPGAEPQ